jgi:hypothetical protein
MQRMYSTLTVVHAVLLVTAFAAENAGAAIAFQSTPDVQTVVWVVELLAFVAAMAVFWVIWQVSKKGSDRKAGDQDNP